MSAADVAPALTPGYVQAVIDHFAPRVKAEMDRVEREMRAAFVGRSIFRHVYDAEYFLRWPELWKEELALAFVQCWTSIGAIHSGTVMAGLGTGEVWVTGWPLEERGGWVRG